MGERNQNASIRRGYPRRSNYKTNAFSNSLEASFFEAIDLAEDSQVKARMEESVLDREFQRKLLMDLIQIEPFSFGARIAVPTKSELGRLDEAKRRLKKLSSLMGVSPGDVDEALSPILSYLSNVAKALAPHASNKQKNVSLDFNDPITNHIMDWSSNQQNLKKILKIAHNIDEHNSKLKFINERNNRYLDAINKFLHGSSKLIDVDGRGNIVFTTRSGDVVRGIESLSSGEVQVFVIMTHLFFNPNARIGNVFIIDEPELSLHIQRQEMFVDSILEASEGVQFILATHSPSVILDRVSSCVEVTN